MAKKKQVEKNDDKQILHDMFSTPVKVDLGTLRKTFVTIGTPCYGGQLTTNYFNSMMNFQNLCNNYEIPIMIDTIANESLITRARNTIVSRFMVREESTHLFFIDADIGFDGKDILRMVSYDKPIVCGIYPKKSINWANIVKIINHNPKLKDDPNALEKFSADYAVNYALGGKDNKQLQITDNLIKIKDGATGFMCIRRDVFEKMFAEYPNLKYNPDINIEPAARQFSYALFDCEIDPENNHRYLSEDYMFCRRWQKMGGEVFLDPRTHLTHSGFHVYQGDFLSLFTEKDAREAK